MGFSAGRQIQHDRTVVAQGNRVAKARANWLEQSHRATGRDDDSRSGGCRALERRCVARRNLVIGADERAVEVDEDEAWRPRHFDRLRDARD